MNLIQKKTIFNFLIFSSFLFFLINVNLEFSELTLINEVIAEEEQGSKSVEISGWGGVGEGILEVIVGMLLGVLMALTKVLLWIAGILDLAFSDTLWDLFNTEKNKALYTGWTMVRDTLNIFFIFFLLFSGLATVFQVSKYHIRSTWVLIIVMALLVNFSWPISRVIIDFSNVGMMYLVGGNATTPGARMQALFVEVANKANINQTVIQDKSVKKEGEKKVVVKDAARYTMIILMSIIALGFYVAIILVITLIFVLRVIALAFLLVLSPVGFVFMAFPSTRSYADKWWSSFIGYCMQGPVVMFFLILGLTLFFETATETGDDGDALNIFSTNLILAFAFVGAAVVAGQQLASSATSSIVSNAQGRINKLGTGWAKGVGGFVGRNMDHGMANFANQLSGSPDGSKRQRLGSGLAKLRATPDRLKEKRDDRKEEYKNAIGESIARGKGGSALTKFENKRVAELKKKHKDDNLDVGTAMSEMKSAKGHELRALGEYLAEHKSFGKGSMSSTDETAMREMLSRSSKSFTDVAAAMEKKLVSEGKADVVMGARMDRGEYTNNDEAYNGMFAKMGAKDLANQDGLMQKLQNDSSFSDLQEALRQRVQNNAGFKQEVMKNASEQYVSHASGQNGIFT